MPRRVPRCPDCASVSVQPQVSGSPVPGFGPGELRREGEPGFVGPDDAAWRCLDCGLRFGSRAAPHRRVPDRTRGEWLELIKTMLPEPVHVSDSGEVIGGDPRTVIVRLGDDAIHIMEARLRWDGHIPRWVDRPFARVPFRAAAVRVAEFITRAHAKRLSRYRWCSRCTCVAIPEHMWKAGICQGCGTRVLGVIY